MCFYHYSPPILLVTITPSRIKPHRVVNSHLNHHISQFPLFLTSRTQRAGRRRLLLHTTHTLKSKATGSLYPI